MVCLFFGFRVNAKVLKDDFIVSGSNSYPWKEVCLALTKRESPLIDYKSISQLNCMGKIVDVINFCDHKEAANPYLARAIVSKSDKTVKCRSGKRVVIKWECDGADDKYCKDKEVGCFLIREKLARRLKLAHSSITNNNHLNCYFDTQYNEI